jgi:hypothetical protein
MRIIGANPNEARFVINRMQANYNATVGIDRERDIVREIERSLHRSLQF